MSARAWRNLFACFERSGYGQEKVDDPDDQCGKQGTKHRDADSADDKLGNPDNQGADQEADDTAAEGRCFFAENAFNDPAEQRDHQSKHECAPEAPDRELRNNPADHHQHDCCDHKPYYMS